MENKYIKIAEAVGNLYAEKLYSDFTEHPEYLGKNFNWDRFYVLCARVAAASLYMYFSDSEWNKLETGELEDICYKAAEERAKEIVSASSSVGNRA